MTYKPYDAREAGDAVVASNAFKSYVQEAIAGAFLVAVLSVGLGATVGGIPGGGKWAARGGAMGAASGGTEGLVLGAVHNRDEMESRVRLLLISNQLQPKPISKEMTHEGLVYVPAVDIKSVKILAADMGGQNPVKIEIPVTMPPQERVVREDEKLRESTPE